MGKKLIVKKDQIPENIDFEIKFYEEILKDQPDFIQALMILGDLYTKKGLHEKGLTIDKKLSQLKSEDPYVLYNLACSYSLVNDIDKAFASMKFAFQCGYDNYRFLEEDEDLTNLLKDSRFMLYLSQLKREKTNRMRKRRNL